MKGARRPWHFVVILGLSGVVALAGCAGPKFMSTSVGSDQAWEQVPSAPEIRVRVLEFPKAFSEPGARPKPDTVSQQLVTELAAALAEDGRFQKVLTGDATGSAPILLEAAVVQATDAGYLGRALSQSARSAVAVVGRVIDTKSERVLLTFQKCRLAQGGLLGMGGWFSPGKESMQATLLDWVVDDIVEALADAGGEQ